MDGIMATRETTMPTRLARISRHTGKIGDRLPHVGVKSRRATRKMRDSAAWRAIVMSAALSWSLLGCCPAGPPIAPVSGVVRLDGKPLADGNICFVSVEGFAASAPLKADGSFQLGSQYGKGIPLGAYRVLVMPRSPEGFVPMIPDAATASKRPSVIPAKYHNLQSSDLRAVVKADCGEFTFDLKHAKR
jgi:hypothetical protein